MRTLYATAALLCLPLSVAAGCIGSGSLQTCYDNSGNSYTVQRLGNNTYVQGYNSQTGSTWNQQSTTMGNTTFHSGEASNGQNWDMTQQQMGGGYQSFSGTNSKGGSFDYICDAYGNCY